MTDLTRLEGIVADIVREHGALHGNVSEHRYVSDPTMPDPWWFAGVNFGADDSVTVKVDSVDEAETKLVAGIEERAARIASDETRESDGES